MEWSELDSKGEVYLWGIYDQPIRVPIRFFPFKARIIDVECCVHPTAFQSETGLLFNKSLWDMLIKNVQVLAMFKISVIHFVN